MRNCLIINAMFIQNDTLWVYMQNPKAYILITIKNKVKMIRNCLIINVMFIQNDTLWVYYGKYSGYELKKKLLRD